MNNNTATDTKRPFPKSCKWSYAVSMEPLLNPKTGEPTGHNAVYHGDRLIHICGRGYIIRQNADAHKWAAVAYADPIFNDYSIESDRDGGYHVVLWTHGSTEVAPNLRFRIGVGLVNRHDGTTPFSYYPVVSEIVGDGDYLSGMQIPVGKAVAFYKGVDSETKIRNGIANIPFQLNAWRTMFNKFFNDSMSAEITIQEAAQRIYEMQGLVRGKVVGKCFVQRQNVTREIFSRLIASVGIWEKVPHYRSADLQAKFPIAYLFYAVMSIMQSKLERKTSGTVARVHALVVGKHRKVISATMRAVATPHTATWTASNRKVIESEMKTLGILFTGDWV